MTRIRQTLGAGKIAHDPTDDTVNKAINKEVGLSGLITFHQLSDRSTVDPDASSPPIAKQFIIYANPSNDMLLPSTGRGRTAQPEHQA